MRSRASCRRPRWTAAVLLVVLYASSGTAQAPVRFDVGRSLAVPFSFRYAGKSSTDRLQKWHVSTQHESQSTGELVRYTLTEKHGLQVIADVRTFADFPNAVDYVLHFRNTGTSDSDLIEDVLPLDITTPALPGVVTVHHARGSGAAATDFEPLEEHFAPGGSTHLASSDGRSSSGASLPFFNVENGGEGIIAAVGWSGNWKADISEAADGQVVHISAGMQRTHFRLHAGEEVRTPRIVLLRWTKSAEGWQGAQNLWRRLLLAHYTPQVHGAPLLGPITIGDSGSMPITTHLGAISWVQRHSLPVTMYAIDAGWYGNSLANDDTLDHSWWGNRGNWYPSPTYAPDGLAPVGDAAKRAGLDFSLWLEPETAMPHSQLVREHPDWIVRTTKNEAAAVAVDLGNPAARAYMTDLIANLVTSYGVTWYRQDSNTALTEFWQLADKPDRVGITEMKHIEGLYTMLDNLLVRFPDLHIDNCAAGGRRLDLEMMSRSFVVWRTDYGYTDTEAVQAQTQALVPWVPETSAAEAYALTGPWLHPGPYSTPAARYLLRLAYSTGLTVGTGAGTINPAWTSHLQNELAEYREVQPYLYADFYALQPYSLDPGAWTAWQWDRPAEKDGVVVLMRRPRSGVLSLPLHLHDIEPTATYMVEVRRTYEHGAAQSMSGAALAKLSIVLPEAPDSTLVFYRRLY